MRNWLEQLLKIACLVLAALLIYRLALTAVHLNPLAHVRVPDLPVLTPETNALTTVKGTNAPVPGQLAKSGTNASVRGAERTNTAARVAGTNTVPAATNATVSRNSGTNGAPLTNQLSSVAPNPALHTAIPSVGTNSLASALTNTSSNAIIRLTGGISGSNATAISNLTKVNPTQAVAMARGSRPDVVILSAGGSSRGTPPRAPELSPDAKARVFRIYDSEILGPVMRPLPMALLGIAGDVAFLRAPSGQTGMVKEGDTLGELKLLKIGINRVLVEEAGQQKELTMFEGFGSSSLLPKP